MHVIREVLQHDTVQSTGYQGQTGWTVDQNSTEQYNAIA